jgi:hypothetical protein
VNPRGAATLLAIARTAVGVGMIANPSLAMTTWIGRRGRTPGATVLGRAIGARDLVLGLGALAGLRGGAPLRAWLAAGILADAADLAATLVDRDSLPRTAVPLIGGAAGSGVLLGVIALAGAESSAPPVAA